VPFDWEMTNGKDIHSGKSYILLVTVDGVCLTSKNFYDIDPVVLYNIIFD
jgi:hypothetical protein